jgi:hypothetical protein
MRHGLASARVLQEVGPSSAVPTGLVIYRATRDRNRSMMRRHQSTLTTALVAAVLMWTPARAGKGPPPAEFIPPTTNFHLRAAFDTDPSVYLGRFIPDGTADIDEAVARKTACSKFIAVREVGGGNVQYDEVFQASASAAIGLGVAQTDLRVGASGSKSTSLRASYVATKKLIADIEDPVAFASCCRQSPGECSNRFVGEFLAGTGNIWWAKSSSTEASALKALQSAGFEVQASKGVTWAKARSFAEPVYFAFRVTEVPKVDCTTLVNTPPKSDKGIYFGAVSEPMASEKLAREMAIGSAREQAIKYLGEQIVTGAVNRTVIGGDVGKLAARFEDEQFVQRAAQGVARFVKDELSCVEKSPSPDGPRFTVRTLAFMPNASLDDAAKAALGQ